MRGFSLISDKLQARVRSAVKTLQKYTDRLWYPPLIGFLAALDNFVVIIPNDGILVSSSMLTPKRWLFLAVCVAVGSTVGAVLLAAAVELQGLPWIVDFFPGILDSEYWSKTDAFFHKHGLLIVFIVAVTPLMQQPVVILASLANTPLLELGAIIFIGRLIKFLIMAYLGSHAPRLLKKMWGMSGELDEVGIEIK
jgi:membrane protein YqaA with SNARE-associated domain